jgi:hypothetical protein
MLQLTEDGYVFKSKIGIEYNIIEGMTIGVSPRKTSDIIFILLNNADYDVENHFVGYLFGACLLLERENEYEESIADLVDKYEKKNGLE